MKKSLLSVGAAIAAVGMLTGCGSLEQQEPGAYLKELNKFMDKATGLENHKRQPENHLLPNASLSSSKASYVAVAGASLDAIELRFGKADELYVAKAMTDQNYLGEWNALRNADKDKAAAAAAEKTLKGVAADAYAQYKTRNKKSVDELYASVIGAVAQTDYVFYKKQLKDGKATAEDYKDQASWLALGKKNVDRVVNEEKKVMDERAKKVAAAEKAAKADSRKVDLVFTYNSCKLAIPGIKMGTAELRKQLAGAGLPPAVVAICCGILEKELIGVMEKQMADAEKEWPGVKTALSDTIEPYKMPKFDAKGINAFNAKAKITTYTKDVTSSLDNWKQKQFGPYIYALEMAGKRMGYTVKAWAWSYDSYKAYKEAAAE